MTMRWHGLFAVAVACATSCVKAEAPVAQVPVAASIEDARDATAERPIGAPPRPVDAALDAASAAPTSVVPSPPVAALPAKALPLGPCPAASAEVQALFARAADLAERSEAVEPHRAIAEAVRMRLDEIYRSGCRASLGDAALVAQIKALRDGVSDPPSIFGKVIDENNLMFGHGTTQSGGVALYTWSQNKMRTRIHVTGDGTKMEQRLLLLDADVFQPSGAKQPLLVVANTHPWLTSCWRTLRFRVLAPSGDPFAPTVLLDRNDGGRWCEEVAIEQSDDEVRFRFDDWGGALTFGQVQRTRVLAFRHVAGALTERFGFAPKIEYFVEDWLAAPWSLAQQATAKDAPSYVEARHDALGAAGATIAKAISSNDAPSLSYELFPTGRETQRKFVIYCALSDSGARCPDWPKPVDFLLEQTDGLWRVRDVTPRK